MKMYIFRLLIIGLSIAYLISCKTNETSNFNREHFIDVQFIDSSVKPGNNFYRFANGKWLDTVKIPADKFSVGGFTDIYYETQSKLQNILQEVSTSNNTLGSIEQKVGDFYISGMDTDRINKLGYEPVKPLLSQVESIKDIPTLMQFVATEEKKGDETIIGFNVFSDQGNSTMNIALLLQTGLGLPDRDYYFRNDSNTIVVQNAYKNYLTKLSQLTDINEATALNNTTIVYQIEKELAIAHKTNIELRDVKANYNKVAFTKIEKTQPNIGWKTFFQNIGAHSDSVDMEQTAYYDKLNTLLKTIPINQWKQYFRAHVLIKYAKSLSKPFEDAAFNYSKVISGQQLQRPRWERIADKADAQLGDALGQLYVKKYFPSEAKLRMDTLVNNLVAAFAKRIQKLDWMSDSTKIVAEEKLKSIRRKIGYPDKWRNYSKVNIAKSKYFENIVATNVDNFEFQLSQLGKPVDESLWGMTPPTINAYYDPTKNDINFPAGILQFPFFDKDADDAVNYGGIGMVIGHEMSHGFDDQGSQYDKLGNIHDWWTSSDKEKFDKKVIQIQKLYDGFTVLDSVHVNGKLTTGENIADLGGVAIAYEAFKMTQQFKDTTKIDGFTPDQRFFLSIAQIWRSKFKDESIRSYINIDPHSPDNWRVIGPLMNFDPFYQVFNVQPGDKMYLKPENRIRIW